MSQIQKEKPPKRATKKSSAKKNETVEPTITVDGARRPERRGSEGLRVFSGDGSPSPEDKPSPDNPRTPTLLRRFGVLAIHLRKSFLLASGIPHSRRQIV